MTSFFLNVLRLIYSPDYSTWRKKKWILLLWSRFFYKCQSIRLVDNLQVSYFLTDFMSTYESRVEITDSYCGFVYFLLLFYQCLVHVLWHHIIRFVIYSWWLEHFTIMNRSLSTVIFSLKSSSDINITIPTLFWFALKWCNFPFFHSYIFVTVLKFSIVATPFYIHTNSIQGFKFLHFLTNI